MGAASRCSAMFRYQPCTHVRASARRFFRLKRDSAFTSAPHRVRDSQGYSQCRRTSIQICSFRSAPPCGIGMTSERPHRVPYSPLGSPLERKQTQQLSCQPTPRPSPRSMAAVSFGTCCASATPGSQTCIRSRPVRAQWRSHGGGGLCDMRRIVS